MRKGEKESELDGEFLGGVDLYDILEFYYYEVLGQKVPQKRYHGFILLHSREKFLLFTPTFIYTNSFSPNHHSSSVVTDTLQVSMSP